MKYHGGKMRNAIISLVVALAIILGSFYYGASNHVSYGQPEETETTVESTEDTESAAVSEEAETIVPDSLGTLGDNSQEEEEAIILGTEDKTQENEAQTEDVDETVAETQDGEEQQDSAETRDNEEKPQSKAGKATEEEEKAEAEAAEKERYKAERLRAVTGVPTDISEYVSGREINDFYVDHKGTITYFVKEGVVQNNTAPIELGNGDKVYLDYKWNITEENIKYIQKDNYFRFALPKSSCFSGINLKTQKVYVKQYLGEDKTQYKVINFGDYNIKDGYLVLTLTEPTEYYIDNIVDEITDGQPIITTKVKAHQGQGEITIPPTKNSAEAKVKIEIKDNPGAENPGTNYKPGRAPHIAKGGHIVDEKTIQWYIQVNRDSAADMFQGYFDNGDPETGNFISTFKPNKTVTGVKLTDEISKIVEGHIGAKVKIKPGTFAVYLDMLAPVKKDEKYVLSGSPAFTTDLYRDNNSVNKFSIGDKVKLHNYDKVEIEFGTIPDSEKTYNAVYGGYSGLEGMINHAAARPNWPEGRISTEQAKIMKAVYGKLPILHYTIRFQTEFEGLPLGTEVKNSATVKDSGGTEKVDTKVTVTETSITDKPTTKLPIIDIEVNKKWFDANGGAILNPEYDYVEVQLLADGKPAAEYPDFVKIEKSKQWTYTFKALKRYKGQNKEIKYEIKERVPNGYKEQSYQVKDHGGKREFEIRNKKNQQKTWFLIKKQWQNENGNLINDTSKLPEIEVKVLMKTSTDSDFKEVPSRLDLKSIKLNKDNKWEFKVENLDKFDSHGKEIQYRVQEIKGADGFLALKDGLVAPSKCGCILVNKENPKIKIIVDKYWREGKMDLNPNHKFIPDKIKIKLLANGVEKEIVEIFKEKNWRHTFENLDKLDKQGKPIKYKVKEVGEVEHFTLVDTIENKKDNRFELINEKKEDEKIQLKINKVWLNTDGTTTLTETEKPNKVVVAIYKIKDGKEIPVEQNIELNKKNNWSYTSKNLDKFDGIGNEISYLVKETYVPDGYIRKEIKKNGLIFTIENQKIAKIKIPFIKKWVDEKGTDLKNTYNRMPDKITIQLYANGRPGKPAEVFKKNNWRYEFTNLDKVDKDGRKIVYTVREVGTVPGFTNDGDADENNNFTITNRLSKENVKITIKKIWKNENGGILSNPSVAELKVNVYSIIKGTKEKVKIVTLNTGNQWQREITDLPKYDSDGFEIKYVVEEDKIPQGYFMTSQDGANFTFTITNQKIPKINISVEKKWFNNGTELDKDYKLLPDKIQIKLLANGNVQETVDVLKSKQWKYTFENLDKVNNKNEKINYTIEEVGNPPHFILENVEKTNDNHFVIKNKKTEETVQLKINKVWLDTDGTTSLTEREKPNKVVVAIYKTKNGTDTPVEQNIELNKKNNWSYTSEKLAKFDEVGDEVNYIIKETYVPDGYFRKSIEKNALTFTVKNQKIPKIAVTVEKKWVDNAENPLKPSYNLKHNKVRVELLADGKSIGKVDDVLKSNNWKLTFDNLDKVDKEGKEIRYTVQEIGNYEGFVWLDTKEGLNHSFTITNKKTNEVVKLKINKEWKNETGNAAPADTEIPNEVVVAIYKMVAGKEVSVLEDIKLDRNNHWSYISNDLAKLDDDGNLITYLVKETKVPDGYFRKYVPGQDGLTFTVINQKIPKINIKVEKKWVDKNNNTLKPDYKKIPDKVEVQVLVKGEVKDTIFVHKNQGWVGEFKDLPKLDQDGNVIDYKVREINVPEGFTVLSTVEDGENKFVITNKKTDEVVKIHITKKWVDLNNQAITDNNLLPENVSFQILANGAVKDTIYVYKNANWIYVSENLPKLDDNGVEIVYTIKEVNLPYGYVATVEKGSYELNFVVTNKHTPPSNPFVPPITPPTPPPDIIIPPAEIPFIPPTTPPTPFDGPDEDVIIDDDDVVKTDKEEDDEVIDDSVPLTNIPKTGVNNPLVYLIGISVLSLVMIFRLKSKK